MYVTDLLVENFFLWRLKLSWNGANSKQKTVFCTQKMSVNIPLHSLFFHSCQKNTTSVRVNEHLFNSRRNTIVMFTIKQLHISLLFNHIILILFKWVNLIIDRIWGQTNTELRAVLERTTRGRGREYSTHTYIPHKLFFIVLY